jgi:large subunit ribosomal protein L48
VQLLLKNQIKVYGGLFRKSVSTSIYDPPYLEAMKPKIPIYDTLNVQMKGYDFVLLENYQKMVYKIAKMMDINVEDGYVPL